MVNRTPSKGDSRVRVTLLALSYSIYLISIVTASLPKPFTPGVAARRAIAPRLGPGLVPWGGGSGPPLRGPEENLSYWALSYR